MDAMTHRSETRTRIVEVAAGLLRDHGSSAVTTRGVADGAGVQAPTIYRLFGDKDGLLAAVAEHVMTQFVAAKSESVIAASRDDVDPVADLRAGWDTQIAFGLENPTLFGLLSDPTREMTSAAAHSGKAILAARVHRIATTGRLRVGEQRAVDMIHAAGTGTVLTILATPPQHRDAGLPDEMFAAVLDQILTDTNDDIHADPVAVAAVAFRANASELGVLSDSEQRLLVEWLDRVIAAR